MSREASPQTEELSLIVLFQTRVLIVSKPFHSCHVCLFRSMWLKTKCWLCRHHSLAGRWRQENSTRFLIRSGPCSFSRAKRMSRMVTGGEVCRVWGVEGMGSGSVSCFHHLPPLPLCSAQQGDQMESALQQPPDRNTPDTGRVIWFSVSCRSPQA